ncbi:MAG: four helix bundle protein [Bacteroidetes bacterium]|nr:four helix bundle protein [Bacteroidota bacterium]
MENLIVYNKAYSVAMEVFEVSRSFPKEEIYSLTDQIRRSSRSICANIGEAYRKRKYPKNFISKLTDADGECTETLVHLSFAKDCGYLNETKYLDLRSKYLEVGKMLGSIINKPENFIVTN